MIHFTNGSSVADALVAGGVPGRVVACADPLHDGPCLPGLSRAAVERRRARGFSPAAKASTFDEVRRDFELRDAAIDEAARADEVVLWFEHDLFDQLNLIWLLDALAGAGTPERRVRLVVIGEHPEVAPFHGLGQLSPAQLLALFPDRQPLTTRGRRRGAGRVADVCAPDPRALARRAEAPGDDAAVAAWCVAPACRGTAVDVRRSFANGTAGPRGDCRRRRTLGEAFAGVRGA